MVNKMVHAWNLFKNFASLKVENIENSIDDEKCQQWMMKMDDIWTPSLHKSIEMWNKKRRT